MQNSPPKVNLPSPALYVHEWLAVLTILGFLCLLLVITLHSRFQDDYVPPKGAFTNIQTVRKTSKRRPAQPKPRVQRTSRALKKQ